MWTVCQWVSFLFQTSLVLHYLCLLNLPARWLPCLYILDSLVLLLNCAHFTYLYKHFDVAKNFGSTQNNCPPRPSPHMHARVPSRTVMSKNGAGLSPCNTPACISHASLLSSRCFAVVPVIVVSMALTIWGGMHSEHFSWMYEVKDFLKSRKLVTVDKLLFLASSMILPRARISATIDLFSLKPFWLYCSFGSMVRLWSCWELGDWIPSQFCGCFDTM